MLFNPTDRIRLMTFELYLEECAEVFRIEEKSAGNFFQAWCHIETMAVTAPHTGGYIRVIDDNGEIVIEAGLLVALETIKHCTINDCSLKRLPLQVA